MHRVVEAFQLLGKLCLCHLYQGLPMSTTALVQPSLHCFLHLCYRWVLGAHCTLGEGSRLHPGSAVFGLVPERGRDLCFCFISLSAVLGTQASWRCSCCWYSFLQAFPQSWGPGVGRMPRAVTLGGTSDDCFFCLQEVPECSGLLSRWEVHSDRRGES